MDFRHIRAFIAVADALSVTKAAERLHISQPPLSRHIHQLEEELGLTLFVRHRQGVTLTEEGRRLLEKARALDAAGTEFNQAAQLLARREERRIRIGIGWGLWDVVNRLRVDFSKQYPDVTFEVRDVYCSDDCQEQLRSTTLDVVFTRPPFDETAVDVAPIFHERIRCCYGIDTCRPRSTIACSTCMRAAASRHRWCQRPARVRTITPA
jgi:DNA-binding transcriptional LysR family regulator